MYGGRGYTREANSQIACIAMVETAKALENLDEIASTPGLDAIYIGPSDLGYALGLGPMAMDQDLHKQTVEHILKTCRNHSIAAGIHTGSLSQTQFHLNQGFNFVTLGTDSAFMMRTAGAELASARASLESVEK